jgi:acetyltransferase
MVSDGLEQLDYFFRPRTVAVVGASSSRGKIGHEIVRSLVDGDYHGEVFPVTLKTKDILGLRCYESVSEIPRDVDLVVYALPSKLAPSILDECGRKGVRNIVVVSGGFKEVGGRFKDLEAEIVSIARRYRMRLIGPNCIGVFDGYSRFDTFFQPYERMKRPKPGPVSIITQSGTYGVSLLEAANDDHVGVNKMVSYGNRADVDEADLIRYLGCDERTKVIAVYMEAVGNGRRLVNAVKEVSPKKPVVVMKVGRTKMGVRTAQSHTGWLAGSYEVARAAFKQAGMLVVDSIEELHDCAKGLGFQPLPKGRRVGMVTNGMGFAVAAVDAAEPRGILVGTHSDETRKKLTETLPSYVLARDVVDLTGSATTQDYAVSMEALLEDPQIDMLIPSFVFQDAPLDEGIMSVLPRLKRFGKPILSGHCGGEYSRRLASRLQEEGMPFYVSGDRIVRVADAMMWLSEYRASLAERSTGFFEASPEVINAGRELVVGAKSSGRRLLLEHEGKALLKKYGIPVAESLLARSPEDAVKVAASLGYPVVLKVVSPDIVHKSDVGGVLTGLGEDSAVKEGYGLILEHVRSAAGSASVEGILVQRMVPQGLEVIMGGVRDREFGPVVMFGLGGIFVEALRDVSFRVASVSRFEAHEMIREIKGYPVLRGARGHAQVDEEALADIVLRLSCLLMDQAEVSELDLNPVFAYDKGAVVADVRVMLE